MSLTLFHGRAFFHSFVPCIIGKASDLETHEDVLGYFLNHREEIVFTGIRVLLQEAPRKQRNWVDVIWNFLIHL